MTEHPRAERGAGGSSPADAGQLVRVRSDRVVLVGMVLWSAALLACLLVPGWRTGERDWWPWACVTGLTLGVLGWVYLRRGRGNAADADAPVSVPPSLPRSASRRQSGS